MELDLEVGDVILTGKFKNKRKVVKSFGKDDLGQPTINGVKALTFRIEKLMPKDKWSKKSKEALEFAEKVDEGKLEITEKKLRRIIRESLLAEAVPGTLGKWVSSSRMVSIQDEKTGEGKDHRVTEWYLPVRGKWGGLVIGTIIFHAPTFSKPNAKMGWQWRIFEKDWKGFKVDKHVKLLKNNLRDAYPKGDFIENADPDFGETMKGEVEAAVVEAGGLMKGDIDTSKPPPAASELVKATADIEGVKVGDTSKRGVTVTYELEGVTGAGARAQLKKLLQPLGFSGFNPGKYHGGGMAFGYGGGGPQKMITAVFDQGGIIFANFSTSSSYGEKTTRVEVRAEWSSEELGA